MNPGVSIAAIFLLVASPVGLSAVIEEKEAHTDSIATPLDENRDTTSNLDNLPGTEKRGQLLYENHCTSCHDSIAHQRQNRKAHSIKDIRQWVIRWSTQLKLGWTANDVDTVTDHINSQYYHFTREK